MSKNSDEKVFAFCVAFLPRGYGKWGKRKVCSGSPRSLAPPCLVLCESLPTPDGHPPWGRLKPPRSRFALLKFGHFFALVSLLLDVAVSLCQLGAECGRERALSIFLPPRMLLRVGHSFPAPHGC